MRPWKEVEALHTAARRYAAERAAKWESRYSNLRAEEERSRRCEGLPEPTTYTYSSKALATFAGLRIAREFGDSRRRAAAARPATPVARLAEASLRSVVFVAGQALMARDQRYAASPLWSDVT